MKKRSSKKKKAGLADLRHPMQPVGLDEHGVLRFKPNRLVDALLEHGQGTGLGLNELHERFGTLGYKDDHVQLAQLIGYSLSGFGELSFVDNATYATAHEMAEDKDADAAQARISALENKISELKDGIRVAMADLFEIHPDDLS